MRHTITMLVAGLCSIVLAETGNVTDAASEPIAIFVGSDKASDFVLAEMRREVESATQRTSIRISWQALNAPRETGDYSEVVVIRLVGDCNGFDARPATTRVQKILGSTHMAGGRILPFGDVFCEPVLQLIRPSLVGATQHERERLLGRALGRVLSHELYHILGRIKNHGTGGLAKSEHSHHDLVTREFRFDEQDEEMFSHTIPESSAGSTR